MIAYTASRQGALVYVARSEKKSRGYTIGEDDEDEDEDGNDNRGSGEEDSTDHDSDNEQAKTLCSGGVTLFLLPNSDGIRWRLTSVIPRDTSESLNRFALKPSNSLVIMATRKSGGVRKPKRRN